MTPGFKLFVIAVVAVVAAIILVHAALPVIVLAHYRS